MQTCAQLTILSATLLIFSGCGNKENIKIETPAKAASQMETAFAGANPEVKQEADAAANALKARDYEQAYLALQTVQSQKELTYKQSLAARDSMFSLQKQLAEASLRGDTNAQRVIQIMRQTQPQ